MKNNLKMYRNKKGYTQEELARALKISLRRYIYYEKGEHEMPVSIAIRIAKLFDIDVEDLFN